MKPTRGAFLAGTAGAAAAVAALTLPRIVKSSPASAIGELHFVLV